MDYKRILVPFEESYEKIPLEKSMQDFQNQFGFALPNSHIKMLSECNGGKFEHAYIQYEANDKIKYNYVDHLYGFGHWHWDLKQANEQHKEEFINNGFDGFVFDLGIYIRNNELEEKLKLKGIIPEYFDSKDTEEIVCEFYNDFPKYISKMDAFIENIDHDECDLNEELIYLYKVSRFFSMSVEFSIDDGHGRYYLYYGDKDVLEPSVYCGVDLREFYKVADSFDDFLKNLVILRKKICFGIKSIAESVCDFINAIIKKFIDADTTITTTDLIENLSNCKYGVCIGANEEININLIKNMYTDGSGYNEAVYREYEYLLIIGSSQMFDYYVDDEVNPYDEFIQKYEKKVINIYDGANKSNIILLYTIGVNKLYDEVIKVP
ncbi:SMI1/KNR4 family protein [Pseudobacteroides cellulosolvens]|uniref:Cell wall assembly/cell proliferation coordinating protein, KNR4-like protein n=1 Tax=Pseudobacteroides cellulosolvens ATCC 35603 = DSM 2933 TaxID=398512 RepID=A0A0L6JQ30_9FIRM|nr:SMI1/KNR4 family protein [Pseudobacteroides cellulosolvens]KNY27790.1 Cell wall assembly/cell proliferation coordinating protein, KNR4-like protein [Pseudobacteroides cellulosolvens ATCC 35603 = DSM 2933]